jgi:hypothetical protein
MSRADVKIQINSLAAMERLIGGDSEVEVEIRNSVAQAFSKKYLHDVVASPAMDKIVKQVRSFITERITAELGAFKTGWNGQIENLVLRSELIQAIKNQALQQIKTLIEPQVKVALDEQAGELRAAMKTTCSLIMEGMELKIRAQVKEEVSALVSKLVRGE